MRQRQVARPSGPRRPACSATTRCSYSRVTSSVMPALGERCPTRRRARGGASSRGSTSSASAPLAGDLRRVSPRARRAAPSEPSGRRRHGELVAARAAHAIAARRIRYAPRYILSADRSVVVDCRRGAASRRSAPRSSGSPARRQIQQNSASIRSSSRVRCEQVVERAREDLRRAVDVPDREVEQRAALEVVEQRARARRDQCSRILRFALTTTPGIRRRVEQEQHEVLRRGAGGVGVAEEVAARLAEPAPHGPSPAAALDGHRRARGRARGQRARRPPRSRRAQPFGTSTISYASPGIRASGGDVLARRRRRCDRPGCGRAGPPTRGVGAHRAREPG